MLSFAKIREVAFGLRIRETVELLQIGEQSPMGPGVIRCNDAELPLDLEDLEEHRINKFRVINVSSGFESLSLRHFIINK